MAQVSYQMKEKEKREERMKQQAVNDCMEFWRDYAQGWRVTTHELAFYEDLNGQLNLTKPAFKPSGRKNNTLENYPVEIELFRYVDAIEAREYLNDLSYASLLLLRNHITENVVLGYVFRSVREWLPVIKYEYKKYLDKQQKIS